MRRVAAGLGSRVFRHGPAQLSDQPGAVERRPAGELGSVHKDDIRPATLGQVIGDRRTADAAADDHRPGVFHGRLAYPVGMS